MDHSCGRAEINQAVQGLPALPTQLADRPLGRCQRQRNHQGKARHSGGDKSALGDVGQHFVNVEKLVEPDVGHQVQSAVEKGEQSEHSPQSDEPVLPGQFPQRRDRQRDQQERQRAITGRVRDLFNWIGAQLGAQTLPDKVAQRHKAAQEDRGFEVAGHLVGFRRSTSGAALQPVRQALSTPGL